MIGSYTKQNRMLRSIRSSLYCLYTGRFVAVLAALLMLQLISAPVWAEQTHGKQKQQKGGYCLVFSSFQDDRMAVSEVQRLKERGFPAFYQKTTEGQSTKFLVLAGPYATKAKTATVGEKLQQMGLVDRIRLIALNKSDEKGIGKEEEKTEQQSISTSKVVSQTDKPNNTKKVKVKNATLPVSPESKASKVFNAVLNPATAQAATQPASKSEKTSLSVSVKKLAAAQQSLGTVPREKPELKKEKQNFPVTPEPAAEVKPSPQAVIPETVSAPAMPAPPVTPAWPYFDAAMKDFQKGLYVKARPVFQDILGRREIGQPWRELAERRLVDCMYFLKESNNSNALSELVYQYKNILFKYPDIRHGNDLAYWRLGHLYKAMALYVDAADALNNLLTRYPGSTLAEEGLFQKGEILRLDKKYPQAAEALQTFYAKYPSSGLSRSAVFALADTYYRMGRSREADVWYNSALQRWPDLYGLPDGIFLNTAYHFYNTGNYRRAFQIFAYFRSLYPGSTNAPAATRGMAKSLAKMGKTASAVRVLSTDLAGRDKKESVRNRLLMAELGTVEPKARTSACFPGVDNYREPLLSCDRMLIELRGDALTDEVLARKGQVLRTMNMNQEAFNAYAALLQLYPKSSFEATCRQGMEETRNILVNDYYRTGDHLAVAGLYFTESGFTYHLDTDVLFKIADSLKRLGLYAQAAKTFQDLKNTQSYPNPEMLDLDIAEAEIKAGKVKEGQARLITLLGQKRVAGIEAKKANRILADAYYTQRNYDSAMAYYAAAMPVNGGEEGAVLSLYRYADTLKRKGQGTLANQYFQQALTAATVTPNALSPMVKGTLQMELAESYLTSANYNQAIAMLTQSLSVLPKGADQRWALFRLTGGYLKTNNPDLAEKSSVRVRENTEDPFWVKMADYGLNDGLWFVNYEDYLK